MRPMAMDDASGNRATSDGVAGNGPATPRDPQRDEGQAELLAVAAHDLRSSLATAQGFVGLLRNGWDTVDPEEGRYYLDRAAAQLADLNSLLGDLLSVSVRDIGLTASEAVTFDLGRLVQDLASAFDETHPDRRICVRVSARRPLVTANPQNLERVLRNLLVNAVAYSPSGSSIQVEVDESDGEAVVAVRDQGTGMSPLDQRRLFRRFSRASENGKGSGPGLYICRRLVETERGRIWVDSEPGCGSTFTLALPYA